MVDVVFEVVGRSKTEKRTKEGKLETTYRVILKSSNGAFKLELMDANPSLLTKYPLDGDVPVRIGKTDQQNLLSEEDLRNHLKKNEEKADS